jgi:hypothetical protein
LWQDARDLDGFAQWAAKTRNVLNLGSGTPHGFKTISIQFSQFPLLPEFSTLQPIWFSQLRDHATIKWVSRLVDWNFCREIFVSPNTRYN